MRSYAPKNTNPAGTKSQSRADTTAVTAPSKEFSLEDLGLVHLFTHATCFSLAGSHLQQQYAWQILAPQEALSQPHLVHGILSIAALHRVYLENDTDSRSLDTAVHHYGIALSKSREALAQLSEQNSSSLFALSQLIAIIALGLPISPASRPMADPVEEIIQIATLMRGSREIVATHSTTIRKGPMAAMIRQGFSTNPAILPPELETALDGLEADLYREGEQVEEDDGHAPYRETITALKSCFRNAGFSVSAPNGTPVEDQIIALSWLSLMHPDFVQLLSRRRPVALVLLAHYAIAVRTLDAMWWCQGWGGMLVNHVYDALLGDDDDDDGNGRWRAKMEWPMRQIRVEPSGIGVSDTFV